MICIIIDLFSEVTMAKYVFFSHFAPGHVNPTLALVEELVRRGHDVSYYLTEDFREIVEATGAIFHAYESKAKHIIEAAHHDAFLLRLLTILQDMPYVPPQIIERVRRDQPDVIIYDFLCVWAKDIVDALQVPAITTRGVYVSNQHFNVFEYIRANIQTWPGMQEFAGKLQEMLTEQAELSNTFLKQFSLAEQLNIVFLSRSFQPMVETFDERYLFIGTSIVPRYQATPFPFDRLDDQLPLLYISLGSIATHQPEFYKQCFAAFGDQPWQVVLSVGETMCICQ
jgi:MGT family glycosyltransferase